MILHMTEFLIRPLFTLCKVAPNCILQKWEKISCDDAVILNRFQYAAGHDQPQITARLEPSSGPRWVAAIDG